jgi:hypothetical protein
LIPQKMQYAQYRITNMKSQTILASMGHVSPLFAIDTTEPKGYRRVSAPLLI